MEEEHGRYDGGDAEEGGQGGRVRSPRHEVGDEGACEEERGDKAQGERADGPGPRVGCACVGGEGGYGVGEGEEGEGQDEEEGGCDEECCFEGGVVVGVGHCMLRCRLAFWRDKCVTHKCSRMGSRMIELSSGVEDIVSFAYAFASVFAQSRLLPIRSSFILA